MSVIFTFIKLGDFSAYDGLNINKMTKTYTRSTSKCRFQQVDNGLAPRH
tara:strand:+ start:9223 stop:9369 length:147 start_codon:yes stop_codon:yes gene_type:complete